MARINNPDGQYPPDQLRSFLRRRTVLRVYLLIYSLLVVLVIPIAFVSQHLAAVAFAGVFICALSGPFVVGQLAIQIHGFAIGILLAALSGGLFLNIIFLIMLNYQATDILRRHEFQPK